MIRDVDISKLNITSDSTGKDREPAYKLDK